MRLRIRFLGGLLAVLGALMLAGASTAWAYGPGGGSATLNVTVSQAANGATTLTVTGSGFGDDETVSFVAYYPTDNIGATTSSASGTISVTLSLPGGYSAGSHILRGSGSVSGDFGTASFTLASASQGPNRCSTTAAVAPGTVVLAAYYEAPCISNGTPAVATPSSGGGAPSLGSPSSGGTPAVGTPSVGTPAVGSPSAGGTPAVGSPSAGGAPSGATHNAVGAPKASGGSGGFTTTDAQLLVGLGAAALCAGGLIFLWTRRRGQWGA